MVSIQIVSVDARRVSIPYEAPILSAYGALRSLSRTLIRVRSDDGLEGWGEASSWVGPKQVATIAPLVVGHSPWDYRIVRERLENVNYFRKTPILNAAIEMAMLDLAARSVELPVWAVLGGKLRDRIPVTAYMFYQHDPETQVARDEQEAIADVVSRAKRDVARHGYSTIKLKGAVHPPQVDLAVMSEFAAAFPDASLRIDPQGAWSLQASLRFIEELGNRGVRLEYLEDPCDGLAAMAEVKRRSPVALATNMCVTDFTHLEPAVRERPVDVILSDIWYWGGIEHTLTLDRAARALGFGIGVHSGVELGIGLAAMLHTAALMPDLTSAMDAINYLGVDDVLTERLSAVDGAIVVPDGPGWGVEVDHEKLAHYERLADSKDLEDRYTNPSRPDGRRPDWVPRIPAW